MYILLPAVYGDSECVNVCWGHQDIAKLNMIGYWEILFGFSYWYAYGDISLRFICWNYQNHLNLELQNIKVYARSNQIEPYEM